MAPSSVTLTWEGLRYSVVTGKDKSQRLILKGLSGELASGTLTALIGPSGSGKTTLLNTLAGRVPFQKTASLQGEVRVNGTPVSALGCAMADISAYVEQDDSLFALSTVRETLMFAGKLRLPQSLTTSELSAKVTAVISELHLTAAADTMIGNERVRGVSGGERKRVNIGVDLLDNPPLVFLDEPTSGLDSFQADTLVKTLKSMARSGRTVIASLHQPRSSIYATLDNILVLTGGRFAYAGEAGEAAKAFFAAAGRPTPADFNPADHFIDTISINQRTPEELEATTQSTEEIVRFFANHNAKTEKAKAAAASEPLHPVRKGQQAGFLTAFILLLKRAWREQTRDKGALVVKFLLNCFFSIMFGLVYFRMDKTQRSLQDRTGILFFMAMNQAFGSSISTSQVIPLQLKVVSKERASKMYDILPYYLSCMIVNLPLEMIPQAFFGAIVYFMVNLRPTFENYLIYLGFMVLENFVGISLGMVLSASFTSVEMAPNLAPAVVILFLMFSGYFLNESSIPVFLSWLKHISFIRYAFQALCVNEFRDANFTPDDQSDFNGNDWLERLTFEDVELWENALVLIGMLIIFNLLAFAILLWKRPRFQPLTQRSSLAGGSL